MKIRQCFLELQLKMSGMFFLRHTVFVVIVIVLVLVIVVVAAAAVAAVVLVTLNVEVRRSALIYALILCST